jgi:hypothetical protein
MALRNGKFVCGVVLTDHSVFVALRPADKPLLRSLQAVSNPSSTIENNNANTKTDAGAAIFSVMGCG